MVRRIARVVFVAWALGACGAPQAPPPPRPEPAVAVERAPLTPPTAAEPTIPGSDVPDTRENRSVIAFCERYRSAMEARDAAALLALASPAYLDDAGTPGSDDDMSYDGLRAYLKGMFASVERISYAIRYRAIHDDGQRIVVRVSHSASYVIEGKPRTSVGDNELVLERHEGAYRVLSGM